MATATLAVPSIPQWDGLTWTEIQEGLEELRATALLNSQVDEIFDEGFEAMCDGFAEFGDLPPLGEPDFDDDEIFAMELAGWEFEKF